MLIESAGLPVPSEPMLLFVGYLITARVLNLYGAIGAAVGGSVAGSLLMYWLGAAGGRAFVAKYGRYIHISPQGLDRSEAWFVRFGPWAVSLARVIPIIRTWVSLPAGLARMPLPQFMVFTAIGVLPWCLALTSIGMGLGSGWESLEERIWSLDALAVVISIVAVLLALAALTLLTSRRSGTRGTGTGGSRSGR